MLHGFELFFPRSTDSPLVAGHTDHLHAVTAAIGPRVHFLAVGPPDDLLTVMAGNRTRNRLSVLPDVPTLLLKAPATQNARSDPAPR